MNEQDIKIGESSNLSLNIKNRYFSFSAPYPGHPIEALIYLFFAGFFFYYSPERSQNLIGFFSFASIYVAALLGLYVFFRYESAIAIFLKTLLYIGFFISTAALGFYFFMAFFSFLHLFIEYFYLDRLTVTAGYLTAVAVILLAWAALKKEQNQRINLEQ